MSGEYSVAKRKAVICQRSIKKRKIMREVNSLRNAAASYSVENDF